MKKREIMDRPKTANISKYICVAVILIFLMACAANCAELPWLKTSGTKIINDKNEVVVLKGFCLSNNAWGNWVDGISEKLRDEKKNPIIRPQKQDDWVLQDGDFAEIADMGANVVRYCVNYELFSKDNPYRESNLKKMKDHIRRFSDKGVYVIIDLHFPLGLDWVQNDNYERYKPGDKRLKSIFEDETYWRDTVKWWKDLAGEFKDNPGVAGYELFNEPRLPSEKDGGIKEFRRKYNEMCREVRSVDKKHILFIPEYNSRETNPGERFRRERTDENGELIKGPDNIPIGEDVMDKGDQGIIWKNPGDVNFIKVDRENIIYVSHIYDPAQFTLFGQPLPSYYCRDFDEFPTVYENNLKKVLKWTDETGKAPLIITEYGVTGVQPMEDRSRYLKDVHDIFHKYGLSSTYWQYVVSISAYTVPTDRFGLYMYYVNADKEVELLPDGSYKFMQWADQPAKESGFDKLFAEYFYKDGKITKRSMLDDKPVKEELERYFKSN